jgi:hypothetical protein
LAGSRNVDAPTEIWRSTTAVIRAQLASHPAFLNVGLFQAVRATSNFRGRERYDNVAILAEGDEVWYGRCYCIFSAKVGPDGTDEALVLLKYYEKARVSPYYRCPFDGAVRLVSLPHNAPADHRHAVVPLSALLRREDIVPDVRKRGLMGTPVSAFFVNPYSSAKEPNWDDTAVAGEGFDAEDGSDVQEDGSEDAGDDD